MHLQCVILVYRFWIQVTRCCDDFTNDLWLVSSNSGNSGVTRSWLFHYTGELATLANTGRSFCFVLTSGYFMSRRRQREKRNGRMEREMKRHILDPAITIVNVPSPFIWQKQQQQQKTNIKEKGDGKQGANEKRMGLCPLFKLLIENKRSIHVFHQWQKNKILLYLIQILSNKTGDSHTQVVVEPVFQFFSLFLKRTHN